jgi:hypothetical protein
MKLFSVKDLSVCDVMPGDAWSHRHIQHFVTNKQPGVVFGCNTCSATEHLWLAALAEVQAVTVNWMHTAHLWVAALAEV